MEIPQRPQIKSYTWQLLKWVPPTRSGPGPTLAKVTLLYLFSGLGFVARTAPHSRHTVAMDEETGLREPLLADEGGSERRDELERHVGFASRDDLVEIPSSKNERGLSGGLE